MAVASASAAASAAAAFDPKMLASAGIDPKMFGLDPKTMASLAAMDPKELAKLDPSLAAMYAGLMGMPSSSHNGVPKSSGASGSTVKAKPGTVAAALEAKKAAAQAEAASASKDIEAKNEAKSEAAKNDNDTPANQNGSNGDKIETNDDDNDEG